MPTVFKAGTTAAGMEVASSNDGLLVFRTSAANGTAVVDALSIAADGKVTVPAGFTSLISTAVAFPATQVASSDANTLDDYEQGSWTPTILFGGANAGMTFAAQVGRYTRVGDLVTAYCYINLSAKGTSTGAATIGGLPFAALNVSNLYAAASLYLEVVTFADTPTGFITFNTSVITLRETTNAGVITNLNDADFANTSGIMMRISYKTAD